MPDNTTITKRILVWIHRKLMHLTSALGKRIASPETPTTDKLRQVREYMWYTLEQDSPGTFDISSHAEGHYYVAGLFTPTEQEQADA